MWVEVFYFLVFLFAFVGAFCCVSQLINCITSRLDRREEEKRRVTLDIDAIRFKVDINADRLITIERNVNEILTHWQVHNILMDDEDE
jgi:hypothetical protein